jgi:hypothetical protein
VSDLAECYRCNRLVNIDNHKCESIWDKYESLQKENAELRDAVRSATLLLKLYWEDDNVAKYVGNRDWLEKYGENK